MEGKSNSFNCVIEGNRCTKCCEAIHTPKFEGIRMVKKIAHEDDVMILKYWRRISKRQAKKINPYMFSNCWDADKKKWIRSEVVLFKCLALKNGVCTIYDNRPYACKEFVGGGMYQYECAIEHYENNLHLISIIP